MVRRTARVHPRQRRLPLPPPARCPLSAARPADADPTLRRTTHGRPRPGREIRIGDPDSRAVLRDGEAGEIGDPGVLALGQSPDTVGDARVSSPGTTHGTAHAAR